MKKVNNKDLIIDLIQINKNDSKIIAFIESNLNKKYYITINEYGVFLIDFIIQLRHQ